ncbi:unnamed protein product [Penicillium bialowiezense]
MPSDSKEWLLWGRERKPLPPGPGQLDVVSQVRKTAPTALPELSRDWHRKYGPIVSFKCGQRVVVSLGTQEVVHDLLNKRGANYSNRPHMVIANSVTNGMNMVAMSIGKRWSDHRRIASGLLKGQMTKKYCQLQDLESKQLLLELLGSNDFFTSFERFSASFIYALAYGKRMQNAHEEEEKEIRDLLDQLLRSLAGSYYAVVEIFPSLDSLPSWLAPWKRLGLKAHTHSMGILERNVLRAQERPGWNWSKESTRVEGSKKSDLANIASVMGALAEGGVESTATTLKVFVMAALLYPDVTKTAQVELDQIVGDDRLPNFDDMTKLPYLKAMMQEVLRWRSIAPFGLFHSNAEDDEYLGYRIPAGACVIPNVWTLEHDDDFFKSPYAFNPARWIENPQLPVNSFGFGKRACPGKAVAENSLLINMSRILWAFNISHVERDGKPVKVDPNNFIFRISLTPAAFEASFQPRSKHRETVVRKESENLMIDVGGILDGMRGSS